MTWLSRGPAAREDHAQREDLRWPARDLATVALLTGCGLRAAELCGLTWQRVELEGDLPRLRVVGKASKERVVPLSPAVVRAWSPIGTSGPSAPSPTSGFGWEPGPQ